MLTVRIVVLLAAFVVSVAAGIGKAPLWIAVVLLAIAQLLDVLPVG
jgi:hypothetical protein